jgi:hypothetical protein
MHRGALALAVCLWLVGCEADDPCGKGYVRRQGACQPAAANDAGSKPEPDSGSEAMPDAGPAADGGGGGGSECKEDQSEVLDKACTNDDGCNCAAPYCAVQPGQSTGFCTVYCTLSPDDCPSGWRCFDLSAVGVQGIKPFCVKK